MKTQILRLDEHDDLISTRDKMNWGQTGRILLVWPENKRLLRRRVDLVILQRHAISLGAQLALVVTDPVVRFHAKTLAIPIFKSLRHAQSAHWRVERRQRRLRTPAPLYQSPRTPEELEALRQAAHPAAPAWMALPAVRVGIFTLGVLAVLALGAVLLPGAEVSLSPQSMPQELNLTVRTSPDQESPNLSGVISARVVTVTVEGRESRESGGTVRVPDKPANGNVVFTNLSDREIHIPAGLVLRSLDDSSIRFATRQAGEISAGPGISITLSVDALTPGTQGNLPAGSLTAIESSLGLDVAATNPVPTRGGRDREVPIPTRMDRDRLYRELEAALRQSALEELATQLKPGDLLFTDTLTVTQVLDLEYTPEDDTPSGQLDLNLRLEYQAYHASYEDLTTLAGAILDANLPEGYQVQPDSLEISAASPPVMESPGVVRWRMAAQRRLQASISTTQAINLVLGLPPQEAASRLDKELPLNTPPSIRLIPSWWPRLPILPFRIRLML